MKGPMIEMLERNTKELIIITKVIIDRAIVRKIILRVIIMKKSVKEVKEEIKIKEEREAI